MSGSAEAIISYRPEIIGGVATLFVILLILSCIIRKRNQDKRPEATNEEPINQRNNQTVQQNQPNERITTENLRSINQSVQVTASAPPPEDLVLGLTNRPIVPPRPQYNYHSQSKPVIQQVPIEQLINEPPPAYNVLSSPNLYRRKSVETIAMELNIPELFKASHLSSETLLGMSYNQLEEIGIIITRESYFKLMAYKNDIGLK